MKSKTFAVWIVMVLAALGVAGIASYVHSVPRLPERADPLPEAPVRQAEPVTQPTRQTVATFSVYTPTMGAEGIAFTKSTEAVPEGVDAKLYAVNAFLRASGVTPTDAEALGVDLRDGVAIIGFNKAFDQTYGSFDEKKLLDGLAATLGQFPDVKSYELEINGKRMATLGSVDLTSATPVIRPEAVPMKPGEEKPATTAPPDQPR